MFYMLISDSLAPANGSACYPSIGFVHIPKCAGTTVSQSLLSCANIRPKVLVQKPVPRGFLFHESAYGQRDRHGAAAWDRAYTFAIVRNPFSWAVSQFFYSMKIHCAAGRKGWFPACEYRSALLDDHGNTRAFKVTHRAFFTAWLVEHDELAAVGTTPFLAPNLISFPARRTGGWTNGTSQLSWLVNQSNRAAGSMVRHIVRLEDTSDFNRHATCDGLQAFLCKDPASSQRDEHGHPPEATSSVAAKTVKRSAHTASSAYYTPRACEIIRRRLAVDFAVFGYDMDAAPCAGAAAGATAELQQSPPVTALPSSLPSRAEQTLSPLSTSPEASESVGRAGGGVLGGGLCSSPSRYCW